MVGRGHVLRTKASRGLLVERAIQSERTADLPRGLLLSAVMGDDKGRGRWRGSRQAADSSPRRRVLNARTVAMQRGLSPSAADTKTILSICLSGQTRVCQVDPVRVLNLYKYFLDLILGLILFSI